MHSHLYSVLSMLPNASLVLSNKGCILFSNSIAAEIFGYQVAALVGKNIEILIPDKLVSVPSITKEEYIDNINSFIADVETVGIHRSGYDISLNIDISILSVSQQPYSILSIKDITEYKSVECSLRKKVCFDHLTGLATRQYFEEELALTIPSLNSRCVISVLFIDLDRFKPINDIFGHAEGDNVLIEVGRRLKAQVRGEDIVSRFGGDEFVLLLRSIHSKVDLDLILSRILLAIRTPIKLRNGTEITIDLSIGATMLNASNVSVNHVLSHADAMMYQAKKSDHLDVKYSEI